jgi:NTE family protein
MSQSRTEVKKINLALQGGGGHGAFTWGVLDTLLDDNRIEFEAISGTSAGAMNAVVMADGYMKGGRKVAKEHLRDFWKEVSYRSGGGPYSSAQTRLLDTFLSFWQAPVSQAFPFFDIFQTTQTSPYDFNPLGLNPLEDIITEMINFERVRSCHAFKLFIAATRVRDGKIKIFKRKDLCADTVLASACLPFLFKAVEIGEEAYWDGGYMGNPPLFPFFTETETEDIVLIQINPLERRDIPKTSKEILERVSEITFNGSLLREFRAIDFVNRLIEANCLERGDYKRNFLHRIDASEELAAFGAASKFDTSWSFFQQLHDIGCRAAEEFMRVHFDAIGQHSTLNLREAFS